MASVFGMVAGWVERMKRINREKADLLAEILVLRSKLDEPESLRMDGPAKRDQSREDPVKIQIESHARP